MIFVTLDANEVANIQDKFDSLTYNEMRTLILGTLTESAGILKRQTIKNVKMSPFEKTDDMEGYSGVRHKVRLLSADKSFATVYLWSWNRILEGGTVLRQTKKGYNRGNIKGFRFFATARQQTENQVFTAMETRFLKRIEKTWNKKMK